MIATTNCERKNFRGLNGKSLSHLRVWMHILDVKCNYMSQEI